MDLLDHGHQFIDPALGRAQLFQVHVLELPGDRKLRFVGDNRFIDPELVPLPIRLGRVERFERPVFVEPLDPGDEAELFLGGFVRVDEETVPALLPDLRLLER